MKLENGKGVQGERMDFEKFPELRRNRRGEQRRASSIQCHELEASEDQQLGRLRGARREEVTHRHRGRHVWDSRATVSSMTHRQSTTHGGSTEDLSNDLRSVLDDVLVALHNRRSFARTQSSCFRCHNQWRARRRTLPLSQSKLRRRLARSAWH